MGQRLRRIRLKVHQTQEEVAGRTGLPGKGDMLDAECEGKRASRECRVMSYRLLRWVGGPKPAEETVPEPVRILGAG